MADNGADGPWVLPRAAMPAVSNSQSRLVTILWLSTRHPQAIPRNSTSPCWFCTFPATKPLRVQTKGAGCPGGSYRRNGGRCWLTSIRSSFGHPLLTALRSERPQVPRRISRAGHVGFLLFQPRVTQVPSYSGYHTGCSICLGCAGTWGLALALSKGTESSHLCPGQPGTDLPSTLNLPRAAGAAFMES